MQKLVRSPKRAFPLFALNAVPQSGQAAYHTRCLLRQRLVSFSFIPFLWSVLRSRHSLQNVWRHSVIVWASRKYPLHKEHVSCCLTSLYVMTIVSFSASDIQYRQSSAFIQAKAMEAYRIDSWASPLSATVFTLAFSISFIPTPLFFMISFQHTVASQSNFL